MPTYNFICRNCEEEFSIEATISEKENGIEVNCSSCESDDVYQDFSGVGVLGTSSAGSFCDADSCPPDRSCCG